MSFVVDWAKEKAAGYLKTGIQAGGSLAGNAVGGVGSTIEQGGRAFGEGTVTSGIQGVGNYINGYGNGIKGAMAADGPVSSAQKKTAVNAGTAGQKKASTPKALPSTGAPIKALPAAGAPMKALPSSGVPGQKALPAPAPRPKAVTPALKKAPSSVASTVPSKPPTAVGRVAPKPRSVAGGVAPAASPQPKAAMGGVAKQVPRPGPQTNGIKSVANGMPRGGAAIKPRAAVAAR